MPQRFLRPGLTTSDKWNSVDWMTQSFYVRLITLVDDYGRYEANLQLLKSHAFPLTEDINCNQVKTMCENLSKSGLVIFYENPIGKYFLQLTNWHEKPRSEPKYQEFTSDCKQLFSIDSKCCAPWSSPSSSSSSIVQTTKRDDYSENFLLFYDAYPRKEAKGSAWKAWKACKFDSRFEVEVTERLKNQIPSLKTKEMKFIKLPATWLNGRCWEDEIDKNYKPESESKEIRKSLSERGVA